MATEAPATPIEFRVLGPVTAVRNGDELSLGGRRQRALLALLLLEPGRPVPADTLLDELWPADRPVASSTLPSYASRLRKALGAAAPVASAGSGYAIDVAPESVDAIRFERLLREGQGALERGAARRAADRFRGALELWRGRPYADVDAGAALQAEAGRLEELRVLCLELRVEADLELGSDAAVVDELEGLVREHPYRERLWRHLVVALYRAGRQADALAAYRRARDLLDAELGLEPGAELRGLEQAILRHELPAPRGRPRAPALPGRRTSFVGRSAEIAAVEGLLRTSRHVTLSGVGGVGKTRLAVEVAARLAGTELDDAAFVDLSEVADPALVPRQVAAAVDVADADARDAAAVVVARLRDADALLVLDNCEHLRDACAELAVTVLDACPGVRVLATSREVLGVPGEVDFPVPPLALPGPDGEAGSSDAVALFLERARAAGGAVGSDAGTAEAAARICRDLDGLPLAIELAAARAKALSLPDIADRLADRFRFLVSWRRLAPARHRTLREAMDWSYDLLAGAEREMLARASVFAGGFTLEAAASVCLDGDAEGALETLSRLVDASLVLPVEAAGATRYRLLETVRQYAASRLGEEPGGTAEAHGRHAAYFTGLAERRSAEVEDRGRLDPLRDLAGDDANLRLALEWLREAGSHDLELRLCASLWRYWWLRGEIAEGRTRLAGALAQAGGDPGMRTAALRGGSSLALRQGDAVAAVALAEEALAAADTLADGGLSRSRALVALANAVSERGELSRSGELYAHSAAGFRAAGRRWELANVLSNEADLSLNQGDVAAAERLAGESLELFRETGDDAGIAGALGNLGIAALGRGDAERAELLFAEGLERSHALGFGEWIAVMLVGLAAAAAGKGDDVRAATLLGASAQIHEEIAAAPGSIEGRVHERTLTAVRGRLGADGFEEAFEAGRRRAGEGVEALLPGA